MNELPILTKRIQGVDYAYSYMPLIPNSSDILHLVTPNWDFDNMPMNPSYLSISLLETMAKHGGVGLAAPQVGLSYRVFAMGDGSQGGYVCFNPEVTEAKGNADITEGCLSYKGLYLNIKRPSTIKVKYQDMNGSFHTGEFDGLTARTFLHELDHLNGIVFTSKVQPYFLNKAKTKVKSNLKKMARFRANRERDMIIRKAAQTVIDQHKAQELSAQLNATLPQNLTLEIPNLTITTN